METQGALRRASLRHDSSFVPGQRRLGLRALLVALACTWLAGPVHARPVRITLMSGGGWASMPGLNFAPVDLKPEPIATPELGVSLRTISSGTLGGQFDLLWVTKGYSLGESEATDPFGNPAGQFETLVVSSQVELAAQLRATLASSRRFHPVLSIGPFVGFETSESLKLTGDVEHHAGSERIASPDWGITVGLSVETPLGPGVVELGVRHEEGFSDLRVSETGSKIHSRFTGFLLGYAF